MKPVIFTSDLTNKQWYYDHSGFVKDKNTVKEAYVLYVAGYKFCKLGVILGKKKDFLDNKKQNFVLAIYTTCREKKCQYHQSFESV